MANLLNEKISSNYRGILNLGDTINQPLSGTLQSITDGMGNASPLSLSTTIVGIGRTGVDGLVNWRRSSDGNGVAAMGVRPGFSDWYFEGNNVNFRTNSTGFFFGGGSTWVNPTARLHVRGDGTNAVARFESSGGLNIVSVRESDHTILFGTGSGTFPQIGLQVLNNPTAFASGNGQYLAYKANVNIDWPSPMHSFWGENQIYNKTTLSNNPAGIAAFNGTFGISNVSASTFDYRIIAINYTINNTAVSNRTATGIFLNATETALNGMTHNLIDLQIGGASRFRVDSSANLMISGPGALASAFGFIADGSSPGYFRWAGRSRMASNADSTITLSNSANNGFDRLQFGGTTNLFPSLKRVGTNLEVRLADDSASTSLLASSFFASGSVMAGGGNAGFYSGGEGIAVLRNTALDGFNRLSFGGTTNLFPALKRNGANLEVRLADDSNFTGLTADIITTSGPNSYIVTGTIFSGAVGTTRFGNALGVGFSAGGNNASAIVDIRSTTRGFLPPRMTTTEKNAITSPAAGLIVYDITLNKLCVFTTVWETITST